MRSEVMAIGGVRLFRLALGTLLLLVGTALLLVQGFAWLDRNRGCCVRLRVGPCVRWALPWAQCRCW